MRSLSAIFVLSLFTALAGCSPPNQGEHHAHHDHAHHDHDGDASESDHGHGDHAETISDSVDQLEEMAKAITAAFAKGSPADAHDELHEIGHLIESLPELAKEEQLPAQSQTKVSEICETLMDAFGELDGVFHGGEEPDVASLSAQINKGIESLKETARI